MLTFVGLGLFDLGGDISVKGLEYVRSADAVFLEAYTSRLMGTDVGAMEAFFGKEIRVLGREDVEQNPPRDILDRAAAGRVAFLTGGGDPMVSTTHADLRLRAAAAGGIETSIIHASSISSAVSGLSGLQNYRFGKSCSVPFPREAGSRRLRSRRLRRILRRTSILSSTWISRRIATCASRRRSPFSRRWQRSAVSNRPRSTWGSPGRGRIARWLPPEPARPSKRRISAPPAPYPRRAGGAPPDGARVPGDLRRPMNLDDYGALYGEALSPAGIAVPDGTSLSRAAGRCSRWLSHTTATGLRFSGLATG